jgi:hypothetical protein
MDIIHCTRGGQTVGKAAGEVQYSSAEVLFAPTDCYD